MMLRRKFWSAVLLATAAMILPLDSFIHAAPLLTDRANEFANRFLGSYVARPNMIRLVLFDIDGTLIQSGGAGEKAFALVCATEFNVPNGTAGLHFAGRTDTSIVREFLQRHRIEPTVENFRRFFDRYVFCLDHMLGQLAGRVLPGVNELLCQMQSLTHPPLMGLLTGNIQLGAQIKLSHYRLWSHFQMGAFGDDHEDRNQLAGIARQRGGTMLRQKLSGAEILVIGDTPRDIECARAIEAKMVAVATGAYTVEQLKKDSPTWAVERLDRICVEELFG